MHGVLYFYLPWVVLYYLWVFLFCAEHIKKKGFSTLYDRVTGERKKKGERERERERERE